LADAGMAGGIAGGSIKRLFFRSSGISLRFAWRGRDVWRAESFHTEEKKAQDGSMK
jgi:hypothetical protein